MIRERMDLRAHPRDGDLLRYLDGELDPMEEAEIRRHVELCQVCGRSLADLESLSDRMGTLLEESSINPPTQAKEEILKEFAARAGTRRDPRRALWAHRLARAAIITLALGGLALAVEPVRAWLVQGAAGLRHTLFPQQAVPVAPVAPPSPSSVSFVPAPGTFFIDVAVPQQTGALRLTVQDVTVATARVTDPSGEEGLLVLPNTLRIINDEESVAEYSVTLPARLSEIRLRIGDVETLSVHTRGLEVPASWSFSLDGDH